MRIESQAFERLKKNEKAVIDSANKTVNHFKQEWTSADESSTHWWNELVYSRSESKHWEEQSRKAELEEGRVNILLTSRKEETELAKGVPTRSTYSARKRSNSSGTRRQDYS